MTQSYFNDFMEEQGCRVVKGVALGVNKFNMPFSAQLENPGQSPDIVMRFALDGSASPCLAYYNKNPLEYVTPLVYGEIIEFNIQLPTDFYFKSSLHSVHGSLAKACEENSLEAASVCPLCGLGRCDSFAWLSGGGNENQQALFPVHGACLNTRLNIPDGDRQLAAVSGSYALGIIGALLGAFMGILLQWIQIVSKNKTSLMSTIMYFLIPIFSTLLYKLFRGKRKHAFASICVASASLIVALAFEQFGFNYALSLQAGYQISFAQSISLYLQKISFGEALKNMSLSLVFLFVGFLPASRLLQGYSRRGKGQAVTIRGANFTRLSAFSPNNEDETENSASNESKERDGNEQ